jgi:hypothetical protein
MRNPLKFALFATAILRQAVCAQIGTITQDVFTMSAFSLQKPCAQSCFIVTGACPEDVLGSKIGCNSIACLNNHWQATNDCYCRSDLQNPAQYFLTSCVERSCDVGDSRIDAASAGSIYAQYCAGKGYSPATEPATAPATATGHGASTVAAGLGGLPTQTSTSNAQGPSSSPGKLSTTTIIGIAVGGLIGLLVLLTALKALLKYMGCGGERRMQRPPQQPVYPMNYYSGPYDRHRADSEIGPDDSVTVVSGMAGPAPTLVSNTRSYPPYRY